mmetsp:Transcript_41374/g.81050  ORF Transcript_41374/g.81050 Transcript_41374/m.81050 type:complete len:237 (-) Transcript_41374:584-1294(-)
MFIRMIPVLGSLRSSNRVASAAASALLAFTVSGADGEGDGGIISSRAHTVRIPTDLAAAQSFRKSSPTCTHQLPARYPSSGPGIPSGGIASGKSLATIRVASANTAGSGLDTPTCSLCTKKSKYGAREGTRRGSEFPLVMAPTTTLPELPPRRGRRPARIRSRAAAAPLGAACSRMAACRASVQRSNARRATPRGSSAATGSSAQISRTASVRSAVRRTGPDSGSARSPSGTKAGA